MLEFRNMPIEIYWRALDLYGVDRPVTVSACNEALLSAEGRLDIRPIFTGITPLAQAVAEYMSLSGPFAEADGAEFAGCNGYRLSESH